MLKENSSKYWSKKEHDKEDFLRFLNWFDKCKNLKEFEITGMQDFCYRIMTEDITSVMGNTQDKNCLEIGFGGGRLMSVASKFFKKCYGIDIHENFKDTKKILEYQGINNFELLKYSKDLKIDTKIDFVYSYIVFQHFDSWEVVEDYFNLFENVTSKDCYFSIYFGRNDINKDPFIEREMYEDHACTLVVNPDFAVKYIQSKGYEIISAGINRKNIFEKNKVSGQFFVKFRKSDD